MTIERDYRSLPRLSAEETTALKAEILAAHARGDREELARLRDIFRSRATITSTDRGPATDISHSEEEPAGTSTQPDVPASPPVPARLN